MDAKTTWLRVFLLWRCLTIVCCQPLVPCEIECKEPRSAPTLYSSPTLGDVVMQVNKCEIQATAETCSVDVADYLLLPSQTSRSTIQYIAFLCKPDHQTRITITNKNGTVQKQIIGYLHVIYCDIPWRDLVRYASAIDLRVLYLQDRYESFAEEREEFRALSPAYSGTGLKQLPHGLQTIGSLQFINTKFSPNSACEILTDYLWPVMAELAFFNYSFSSVPESLLQMSMPNLQSLELKHNQLTEPFSIFPWTDQWLNLPVNLSRTPNSNHHYSQSQGFVTPPQLYRRIVDLAANKLTNLTDYAFTGCLQKIDLSYNQIEQFSPLTFGSVMCLQNLDLKNNKMQSLPSGAFVNLVNLTRLKISHNHLTFIPHSSHFKGLVKLQNLDLSNNRLTSLGDQAFHPLVSAAEIILSSNNLVDVPDTAIKYGVDKLVKVNLQHNAIKEVPHWVFLVRSLLEVDLSHNRVSFDSFLESIRDLGIEYLHYSNRWSASQFGEVQRTFIKVIKLQNNDFTTLDVSNLGVEHEVLLTNVLLFFNLNLNQNTLICDCHTYHMQLYMLREADKAARADADYNTYADNNWRCSWPPHAKNELISSVANTTFKCEAHFEDCPEKCTCFQRAVDEVVEVECAHKKLTAIPQKLPTNARILNMAYNDIKTLDTLPAYLHDLEYIDFSFNNITYISGDFLNALQNVQNLLLHHNKLQSLPESLEDLELESVSLRSNPWVCDCHAVWFKQWIVVNRETVEDLDEVTCTAGRALGSVLIEVPESDFICEVPTAVVIAKASVGFLAFIIVILVILLILYKYRGEIKVFLYVHFKWHPFDRSEKTDVDFEYDAFVSYAGDDYKWVVFQLVARLEGHVPKFKLCLHDRDFEVGAPIQENILQAVRTSRRMILVLTQRYLRSEWCMLEFRAAHERVMNDRSNYLILVLFDDVQISDLDEHMQLYIRTNTYLSVSNKWFWEKLLYSMPKEPLCTLRDNIRFDFAYLAEPPKSYPEYMRGYMASNRHKMAENSELPEVSQALPGDSDDNLNTSVDALTVRL